MKELKDSQIKSRLPLYQQYRKRRTLGLRTGIKSLDDYLQGLGGLVNIQGETSSCKSALALQIVHYNLRRGMPCVMLDKENGDARIVNRMLCQAHRTYEDKLKTSSDNDVEELLKSIEELPMHLHTEQVDSAEVLRERLASCWETYKKPFMLLVDSIQAMDKITDDQRVNLEDWVYMLDRLKVEYAGRLYIIVVSEKNRMSYGQQGVGGGKGSNVLDYKPETVLDIKWNEDGDSFTMKVSKHRDGLRGGVFELRKVLTERTNPRSFCFLLEDLNVELP